MRYTTILFDADNTLLDFSGSEKQAHKKVSLKYGLDWNESLYKTYSEINDKWWTLYEKKQFTREEIVINRYKEYLSLLNANEIDASIFNDEYRHFLAEGRDVIDGATQTLKEIKALGGKIYIVTNGTVQVQNSRLSGQEFMKYVDGVQISEDGGHPKPDVEFFTNLSNKYNVKYNEQTLIVGDSLSSDIKGGNNVNIDTCWFNPNGKKANSSVKITYEIKRLIEVVDIVK